MMIYLHTRTGLSDRLELELANFTLVCVRCCEPMFQTAHVD